MSRDSFEPHLDRRFIDTLHGRITYIERGGNPAALFLHGLPCAALNGPT